MVKEIDARAAAELLRGESRPLLLDVREPEEVAIAAVAGALCIPMAEIPSRIDELDVDKEIICMCHHGMRSAQVAGFLEQQGFANLSNLTGGIDAWAATVDETMPRY